MNHVIRKLLFLLFLSLSLTVSSKTYYVAVWGNDSNTGTIDTPWGTWQKAFETAQAGDTVYFRGGIWYPSVPAYGNNINLINPKEKIGHNGSPGKPICFFNYPGETPILDCKNAVAPTSRYSDNRYLVGITMYDAHWLHFKGLTIRNVYQREANVSARGIVGFPISNMTFESMTIHNIGAEGYYMESDVGFFEGSKYGWDGSGFVPYDTTRYINCDTYQCCDSLPSNIGNDPGNMGDGFKHINMGAYVSFENCRAWYCSDDGFDMGGYGTTTFTNCWSFANGLTNGVPDPEHEGNGFKVGGNSGPTDWPKRILTNCLSAYNKASGIFILEYQGYTRTRARIYNCTVYKNGYGITISHNSDFNDSESIIRNTIVYGSTNLDAAGRPYELDVQSLYKESNNTFKYANLGSISKWTNSTNVTVSDDDFVATSYQSAITQLTAERKGDFSLPDVSFMALKESSGLIDAGTQIPASDNSGVVLSYYGSAPDIGYKEFISGNVVLPSPIFSGATIENATPARLEMSYDLTLANIRPAVSSFTVKVNSNTRNVSSVAISGNKVLLTLASPVVYGETVTVTYTKPSSSPLQSVQGGQAASITAKSVTNNCTLATNNSPTVSISSPSNAASFNSPANISIVAVAEDSDGTISRVEFFNGSVKLGEKTSKPYSFIWTGVSEGSYSITAVATDNLNAKKVSAAVSLIVKKPGTAINQLPEVIIISPAKESENKKNDNITFEITASDPDGTIDHVELRNGSITLAEFTEPPYIFVWHGVDTGTYYISALATDNLGATSVSPVIEVKVGYDYKTMSDMINLYPNPSDGRFTLEMDPLLTEQQVNRITIVNLSGKTIYNEKISRLESSKSFDLSGVDIGTYIILITNEKAIIATKKFIKQ